MKPFTLWTAPILERSVTEYYINGPFVDCFVWLDKVAAVSCWGLEQLALHFNGKAYYPNAFVISQNGATITGYIK